MLAILETVSLFFVVCLLASSSSFAFEGEVCGLMIKTRAFMTIGLRDTEEAPIKSVTAAVLISSQK